MIVRRKTKKPIGPFTLDGEQTINVPCLVGPEGKKNVIALKTGDDKDKGGATFSLVYFIFEGETLEMLGEIDSEVTGKVNLTGRWQRPGKNKKK